MLIGALTSAVGAIAFQLIGTRALGEVEFAPIALMWTIQFLGFTVLYTPVEQLIIRRLTLAGGDIGALRSARVAIASVIVAGSAVAGGFVALNRESSFQGNWLFVAAAVLLFLTLGTYAVGRGILAGRTRFRDYGMAVTAESATRIVLAGATLVIASTAASLAWALVLAPLAFLVVRPFRGNGGGSGHHGDASSASGFLTGMVVMTSASQTILAAGPLVVDALGAEPGAVTTFFVTFTLFRGPLSTSYNLLARVLPWFTAASTRDDDPRLRKWSLLIGVGGVVAALIAAGGAAVLGPWIVELLFESRPSAGLAALAAAGVILGALALFLAQVLVGRGATGALAAVWLAALAVAALTLGVLDVSPSIRTGWAFVAGEAAALFGTVLLVIRPRR